MNEELKQLIEGAAKLCGVPLYKEYYGNDGRTYLKYFNPCDPERGDLLKLMEAAKLWVNFNSGVITSDVGIEYAKPHDHQSLVLAILRAASAVYKARGER